MYSSGLAKLGTSNDAASTAALQVDVIADLICPWCYMGKRRLDRALASVRGPNKVSWYPFQLNPDMPASGMDFEEYLVTKFGDLDKLRPAIEQLEREGREENINFRFDRLTRIPNTLDAHRLMKLAHTHGASPSALAERILEAFFERGQDIADRELLAALGAKEGLLLPDVYKTFDDESSEQLVLSQEAQVRKNGVTGVPDFLVNKRLFVVGAQSANNLLTVFDRVMFGEDSDLPVSPTLH
jgi:predicted DsbA family dithiol-disulfide isomerase